jgi:hypothetical protein
MRLNVLGIWCIRLAAALTQKKLKGYHATNNLMFVSYFGKSQRETRGLGRKGLLEEVQEPDYIQTQSE